MLTAEHIAAMLAVTDLMEESGVDSEAVNWLRAMLRAKLWGWRMRDPRHVCILWHNIREDEAYPVF